MMYEKPFRNHPSNKNIYLAFLCLSFGDGRDFLTNVCILPYAFFPPLK